MNEVEQWIRVHFFSDPVYPDDCWPQYLDRRRFERYLVALREAHYFDRRAEREWWGIQWHVDEYFDLEQQLDPDWSEIFDMRQDLEAHLNRLLALLLIPSPLREQAILVSVDSESEDEDSQSQSGAISRHSTDQMPS